MRRDAGLFLRGEAGTLLGHRRTDWNSFCKSQRDLNLPLTVSKRLSGVASRLRTAKR